MLIFLLCVSWFFVSEMDKEVREALKPIIADARSRVPAMAPGGLFNYNYPGYERKSRTGRKDVKKIAKPQRGIEDMLKAVGGAV